MIMLVSLIDGKLIEMQSDGDQETLLQNAIAAGFDPNEVEIREVDENEYLMILESQPLPITPPSIEERIEAAEQALLAMMEAMS